MLYPRVTGDRLPHSHFNREAEPCHPGWQGQAVIRIGKRCSITFAALMFLWVATSARADSGQTDAGLLRGRIYVGDADQGKAVVGAKVVASGAFSLETVTDDQGKFHFSSLPAGVYTLTVTFSGLQGTATARVEGGRICTIAIEVRPEQTISRVVVEAGDPAAAAPTPTSTIDERTLRDAPNWNERAESLLPLVPGVVRGPDGHVNMKGTRDTQSGALVNSANVTDPATGSPAIDLPIDVVSSVRVISNPYDPQYGRFTGAVSSLETKTSNYDRYHFSIQDIVPRWRERGGHIAGLGAATPRMSLTGPVVRNRLAFTQSGEYRFVRTPVNSLPPFERDTTLESFDLYSQMDATFDARQTATFSVSVYPEKLRYLGLNTFTPQPSTEDLHQRGYQIFAEHHYVRDAASMLTSDLSYKTYDVDTTAQSDLPYLLLIDSTEGGAFNRQARRASRLEWQESYVAEARHFLGTHAWHAGLNYAWSDFDGRSAFLPVEIAGASGRPIERITFTPADRFSTDQTETSWFVGDAWSPGPRATVDLGLRCDYDSITSAFNPAPRVAFVLDATRDHRTVLRGGAGLFYDRVPLTIPIFEHLPSRTVSVLDSDGAATNSISYRNQLTGPLQNPRSVSWNLSAERRILDSLAVRVNYEQRDTSRVLVLSPEQAGGAGGLDLSNSGKASWREIEITGQYKASRLTVNSSYVHSYAWGDLNDPSLYFGNSPLPVVPADERARLPFDAPNRILLWGTIEGPGKLTLVPVYDLHTGFPWSPENQVREYAGPPDSRRFPRFSSFDLQVTRPLGLHVENRHLKMRAGFSVYNVFNHFNPRDVQNVVASNQFGGFFNDAWRDYRGKLVFEF